ncbi:hypothetical protein TcCL_Unassigned06025, partial [Trypanosoma cruzi]
RCRVCDKVKPLAGQHLSGKTEVRSDCWPCAAKRTFYRTATQNTFTAKPHAESPLKNVFGAPSSTAAKPPAESPFKSVFGAPSSTDAKPPAESPFKSVFGAPSSTDAKPPAELAVKELGGTSCGKNGVWKCSRCGKAKDLSGEHLKNKTEVRSDCWPCARKSTFILEREKLSVCGKQDVDEDDNRKPVINLSSTSGGVKAVVAFEPPRIPVEAEEHLFLSLMLGTKRRQRNPRAVPLISGGVVFVTR